MREHGLKVIALALVVSAGLLLGACAHTAHSGGYAYARVISVEPIYETYAGPAEREICWQERGGYQRAYAEPSVTPIILGAIIGGILGNQITKGSHWNTRDTATFAGAVLGGAIAHDAQAQAYRGGYYDPGGERCTIQRDRGLAGADYFYDVAYEHRGRIYHARIDHDPGDFIRVRADGAPVP